MKVPRASCIVPSRVASHALLGFLFMCYVLSMNEPLRLPKETSRTRAYMRSYAHMHGDTSPSILDVRWPYHNSSTIMPRNGKQFVVCTCTVCVRVDPNGCEVGKATLKRHQLQDVIDSWTNEPAGTDKQTGSETTDSVLFSSDYDFDAPTSPLGSYQADESSHFTDRRFHHRERWLR